MKKLFLDDVRTPHDTAKYVNSKELKYFYEDDEWDIVRTYKDFVGYISTFGLPDVISFDHDLAKEHYSPMMFENKESYNKLYEDFEEKTGYDCAKWLVNYCVENALPLPTYFVHSMNPVGSENIFSILDSYKKKFDFDNKQNIYL